MRTVLIDGLYLSVISMPCCDSCNCSSHISGLGNLWSTQSCCCCAAAGGGRLLLPKMRAQRPLTPLNRDHLHEPGPAVIWCSSTTQLQNRAAGTRARVPSLKPGQARRKTGRFGASSKCDTYESQAPGFRAPGACAHPPPPPPPRPAVAPLLQHSGRMSKSPCAWPSSCGSTRS